MNEFCDNDPNDPNTFHNKHAPTLHNRGKGYKIKNSLTDILKLINNKECGGKSVWEVLRNHDDFKDYKSMPNNFIESAVPKFKLIKKRPNKIVLLIDKSIRDMQPELFSKLKTAMNDYIKLMVNDNDLIGVIHFENFAEINLEMTWVKDSQTRKKIMESTMPTSSSGKISNVWNGLDKKFSFLFIY